MARRQQWWWAVRVDLLGGGPCGDLWPHPGRIFAVDPQHTLHQLAEAIDDAFARWDRSHLHEFEFPHRSLRAMELRFIDDAEDGLLDAGTTALGDVAALGDEFGYTFDLGDMWRHHCAVAPQAIDPDKELGIVPDRPLPYSGWGALPDQYGRQWDGDDGESPVPAPDRDPWPWPNAPKPVTAMGPGPGPVHRPARSATCRPLTRPQPPHGEHRAPTAARGGHPVSKVAARPVTMDNMTNAGHHIEAANHRLLLGLRQAQLEQASMLAQLADGQAPLGVGVGSLAQALQDLAVGQAVLLQEARTLRYAR
jgi:hypothetical protein